MLQTTAGIFKRLHPIFRVSASRARKIQRISERERKSIKKTYRREEKSQSRDRSPFSSARRDKNGSVEGRRGRGTARGCDGLPGERVRGESATGEQLINM